MSSRKEVMLFDGRIAVLQRAPDPALPQFENLYIDLFRDGAVPPLLAGSDANIGRVWARNDTGRIELCMNTARGMVDLSEKQIEFLEGQMAALSTEVSP